METTGTKQALQDILAELQRAGYEVELHIKSRSSETEMLRNFMIMQMSKAMNDQNRQDINMGLMRQTMNAFKPKEEDETKS